MKAQLNEELLRIALLAVAVNSIMLDVCDEIKNTDLYRGPRKKAVNNLTQDLERFMYELYKGMNEEQEMQYMALIRTVKAGAVALASVTPDEFGTFAGLIEAFRTGEVYQATSDTQMKNMINHKKVKRVG